MRYSHGQTKGSLKGAVEGQLKTQFKDPLKNQLPKPQASNWLERLGLIGFSSIEAPLLAALVTGSPLLLIGAHGGFDFCNVGAAQATLLTLRLRPFSNTSRGKSLPINTILLSRTSSFAHGAPRSEPINMWTP